MQGPIQSKLSEAKCEPVDKNIHEQALEHQVLALVQLMH